MSKQNELKWEKFKVGYAPSYIKIRNDWRVLDVGSGHNPHPRANVLLEKFINEDFHRSGSSIKKIDKLLIIGDVLEMPFKDKEFDYIIASHIAEHLDSPEKFCQELMRVGKAGYIETPGKLAEIILDEPFHKWYVFKKDGKLIFEKIKKRRRFSFFGDLFYALLYFNRERIGHKTLKTNNPMLVKIFTKVRSLLGRLIRTSLFKKYFYTIFEWRGEFEFEVKE